MNVRYLLALLAHLLDRLAQRTEGGTPSEHHQVAAVGVAKNLGRRNLACDTRHLAGACPHHQFVVGGRIADVAGDVLAREAAYAVLEAWSAGYGPRAGQGLSITLVGHEAVGIGCKLNL